MSRPVYIVGSSDFLPYGPVSNEYMEEILGEARGVPSRVKRRILQSNGIEQRYYAIDPVSKTPTYSNADLTAMAVRALAEKTELDLSQLDLMVCGTSTADQIIPNHAQMVQGVLGIGPLEVISTAGVCCSSTAALKYAAMSIQSGQVRNAVATGSELVSNILSGAYLSHESRGDGTYEEDDKTLPFSTDFLRWMLSDGAGALQLSPEPNPRGDVSLRIDWIDIKSYAHQYDVCMYQGGEKDAATGRFQGWRQFAPNVKAAAAKGAFYLNQDARQLSRSIARATVLDPLPQIMKKYELRGKNVDWFLPHYSSQFFRPLVEQSLVEVGLPIPTNRWFTNLVTKGNTGSASIYIMLNEMLDKGLIERGQNILCFIPESARFSVAYMHLTAF